MSDEQGSGAKFDPDRILAILNRHEVDFLVIGGLAVNVHGFNRGTADVDMMADQSGENLERLAAALEELGARLEGVDAEHLPVSPNDPEDLGNGANWTLQTDAGKLDYLPAASGAREYRLLAADAVTAEISDAEESFRVVGLDDLIAMKLAAGRARDYLDVANLAREHPELGLGSEDLEQQAREAAREAVPDAGYSPGPQPPAARGKESPRRWWGRRGGR